MSLQTNKKIRLDGGIWSSTHEITANVEIIDNSIRIITKLGDKIVNESPIIALDNIFIKDIIWCEESDFGWVYGFSCAVIFNDNSVFIYTKSWHGGNPYSYSKFLKVGENYDLLENDGSKNWGQKVSGGSQTFTGVTSSSNCHGYWLDGNFIDSNENKQSVIFLTPSQNAIKKHIK